MGHLRWVSVPLNSPSSHDRSLLNSSSCLKHPEGSLGNHVKPSSKAWLLCRFQGTYAVRLKFQEDAELSYVEGRRLLIGLQGLSLAHTSPAWGDSPPLQAELRQQGWGVLSLALLLSSLDFPGFSFLPYGSAVLSRVSYLDSQ